MMVETGSTQKTYVPSKIVKKKKKEITIKCGPIFWSPPVKRPQNDSFELWNVNSTQT